mmetsp:Transcript_5975/g.10860  ORF Transcript_5975/g.10860 Transcript_5975/m.10860 type:complete len:97 (+) Transcript_5975:188-478(+)
MKSLGDRWITSAACWVSDCRVNSRGKRLPKKLIQGLRVIKYAVSLGHHRSLIWFMPTEDLMQSSFELDGEQLQSYKRFAGDDGIFRLSLGLEDDEV